LQLHFLVRPPFFSGRGGAAYANCSFIKGQKYTLLSNRENLTLDGRRVLKELLRANRRSHLAYLLKESFKTLWSYQMEGWAAKPRRDRWPPCRQLSRS
jgi:hypothetical protein